MESSASAVYSASAPYSSRTTLLMSVEAANGCGSGPGSTSRTRWPRLRSSMAAVIPKIPPPATRTVSTGQGYLRSRYATSRLHVMEGRAIYATWRLHMNTDRIEKKLFLQAPRARVWKALADARQFGAWFGVEFQGAFQAGARLEGRLTIKGDDHLTLEAIVERVEPERLL